MAEAERWARLERYARCKRRMHLHRLPCDVLLDIATRHLDGRDVIALAGAYVGRPCDWNDEESVARIPTWLLLPWLRACGRRRVHDMVSQLADDALWIATSLMQVSVYVDWSPYSPFTRAPLATYAWTNDRPHVRTDVNEHQVDATVFRALLRGSNSVYVALYLESPLIAKHLVHSFPFTVAPRRDVVVRALG